MEEGRVSSLKTEASLKMSSTSMDQGQAASRTWKRKGRNKSLCSKHVCTWETSVAMKSGNRSRFYATSVVPRVLSLVSPFNGPCRINERGALASTSQ